MNRKFKRLAAALDTFQAGFGSLLARGVLEALWEPAFETGDDFLGDAADVEARIDWRGPPGLVFDALLRAGGEVSAGFIEEGGSESWPEGKPGTYRIHDLYDHAPNYAKRRMALEAERRANGQTLSSVRSEAGRRGGLASAAKRREANGKQSVDRLLPDADGMLAGAKQEPPTSKQAGSKREQTVPCNEASQATPARAPAPAPVEGSSEASSEATPPSRVLAVLPCVGEGVDTPPFQITEAMVEKWKLAFPAVDVLGAVRRAILWCEAQPSRRKTRRGAEAFLVRWLGNDQDHARGTTPTRPPPPSFAGPVLKPRRDLT